jgi:hypothetical protein
MDRKKHKPTVDIIVLIAGKNFYLDIAFPANILHSIFVY